MARRTRRLKAALITLGVIALVCGSVAAGMWWEATQERVCACLCHVKMPGYLQLDITRLDDKRERCDYCGEPEHPRPFMCPRITRITYHEDGDVTISFTQGTSVLIVPGNADPAA